MSQSVRARRQAGLTLVETTLIVSVLAVLLAIVVPTFGRTLQVSKVAEASSSLEALYRASASYYAVQRTLSSSAAADGSTAYCLPDAAGPAPEKPSIVPVAVDFQADTAPGVATWRALGFQLSDPVRYSYSYLPASVACRVTAVAGEPLLILRAEGDLDGDGVRSRFERSANVAGPGQLAPDPVLHVQDRVE
ncbi:MAG TPA: hypothetical protein VHM19_00430 [Polyangiales bacterium]|jgi:Tfp pilus assembly protein PilE|nr:hypothetical protein [Polyangiales bacterium]